MERLGSFLPGELARPAGQKQHIGSGQRVLAIAPGNLLDHHTTISPVDPSPAVCGQEQNWLLASGHSLSIWPHRVFQRRPFAGTWTTSGCWVEKSFAT